MTTKEEKEYAKDLSDLIQLAKYAGSFSQEGKEGQLGYGTPTNVSDRLHTAELRFTEKWGPKAVLNRALTRWMEMSNE